MTPADELRQAAATLRRLAAEATPGPWAVDRAGDVFSPVVDDPHPDVGIFVSATDDETDAGILDPADARWIATVSPAIAGPLAQWLEKDARSLDQHLSHWGSVPGDIDYPAIIRTEYDTHVIVEHHFGHALALARRVNQAVTE